MEIVVKTFEDLLKMIKYNKTSVNPIFDGGIYKLNENVFGKEENEKEI